MSRIRLALVVLFVLLSVAPCSALYRVEVIMARCDREPCAYDVGVESRGPMSTSGTAGSPPTSATATSSVRDAGIIARVVALDPLVRERYAAHPGSGPAAMADHGIADDQYEVLGEAGDCSVYRCEHGCLHVQIGDVNLRIEDDRFAELAEAVAAATQASPDLLRWANSTSNGPAH